MIVPQGEKNRNHPERMQGATPPTTSHPRLSVPISGQCGGKCRGAGVSEVRPSRVGSPQPKPEVSRVPGKRPPERPHVRS